MLARLFGGRKEEIRTDLRDVLRVEFVRRGKNRQSASLLVSSILGRDCAEHNDGHELDRTFGTLRSRIYNQAGIFLLFFYYFH